MDTKIVSVYQAAESSNVVYSNHQKQLFDKENKIQDQFRKKECNKIILS